MKNLFLMAIIVIALFACGCGSVASTQPAPHSKLKINKIELKGDDRQLVADAIGSELLKAGAVYTLNETGLTITGDAKWEEDGAPTTLTVNCRGIQFGEVSLQVTESIDRRDFIDNLNAHSKGDFAKLIARRITPLFLSQETAQRAHLEQEKAVP